MQAASTDKAHDATSSNRDSNKLGSRAKKKYPVLVDSMGFGPSLTLPPICHGQPPYSPAFEYKPLPGRTPILENVLPSSPLSVLELPRLIAQVGPARAIGEAKWMEGPRLMASVLGTDLPVIPGTVHVTATEPTVDSLTDEVWSMEKKEKKVKSSRDAKPCKAPITGAELAEIFEKRHSGELEFFYLKEVDEAPYRPYDLQVIRPGEAGSEHYIFSPGTVLHVTEQGCETVTLARWHRECVMWRALQGIPYFRHYQLRKAFTRWHRNVCSATFQRKREKLRDMLLMAVPHFREALLLFSRVIEELKGVHWLPLDESKTYTLLEFKTTLKNKSQRLVLFEKLLQYRTVILNAVQEDSYRAHQELQLCVEDYSKQPCKLNQPMHLQVAHLRDLKEELAQAESVLQRLGNMAVLVDQMTMQGLVTITRGEVTSFLNNVLKRGKPQQGCLFQAELVFSADGQLTLHPPMHLFHGLVLEATTVADTVLQELQIPDDCRFFLDTSDIGVSGTFICSSAQDLTPDLSLAGCSKTSDLAGENKKDSGTSGLTRPLCEQEPSGQLAHKLVLPKLSPLMVQGQRLRGSFCALSKKQLEWNLSVNGVSKETEREQARITEEARLEFQRWCGEYAWLADIHLFTSQWSPASLGAMKSQPASLYESHIERVHHWTLRLQTVPPSFTTANQLFTVHCAHIREKLGLLLKSIEEDMLTQLTEDVKQHSEGLISDLKRATVELESEPINLYEFTEFASMVKRYEITSADMQRHLEYVCSLQDVICVNCRKTTEREVTTEEQVRVRNHMQSLWDGFVPLLKRAEEAAHRRLPSASHSLDQTFSSSLRNLHKMVSSATSGLFLDPTQNANEILAELDDRCRQVYTVSAKLEKLSQSSQDLRGQPLDLTLMAAAVQQIEDRRALWELVTVYTADIEEWRQLPFSKFMLSHAQEKVEVWQQRAVSLTTTISTQDAVLQETMQTLEHLNLQLLVMAKLSSPTLKHKHWRNIYKDVGLLYVPESKLTVAELMSEQLSEHQEEISKICREAQAEWNVEQEFRELQQGWESKHFELTVSSISLGQLDKRQHESRHSDFASNHRHASDSDTLTITGLETILAETEDSVMTLTSMLPFPQVDDFRLEVEHWVQLLQELEGLLDFLRRYQETWAFLTKMLSGTTIDAQRVELLEKFHPVDQTFWKIIQSISRDTRVLNIVGCKKTNEPFYGTSLRIILMEGLSAMEAISNRMLYLLDSPRAEFPRLCFLSDRDVVKLLSLPPTLDNLLPVVRKCFKGVCWLETDHDMSSDETDLGRGDVSDNHMRKRVLGVYGSFREHVSFLCPVEPNLCPLVWLSLLEKQLHQTMMQLMKQCAAARQQLQPFDQDLEYNRKAGHTQCRDPERREEVLSILEIVSHYPLQCLLVAEEAAWCSEVVKVHQSSSPVKWTCMKTRNASKLQNLCHVIREIITGATDKPLASNYIMMVLRALVHLTMNHAQQLSRLTEVKCDLLSSFEWQRLMKYHITTDSQNQNDSDYLPGSSEHSLCYVDTLGTQLTYSYEYHGPEHWLMVNMPSTDRAILGILLALTSYRCGFVSGPCMSGKRMTVLQLGRALGRQVITLRCFLSVKASIVQRMLFGALQTGAWLVLASVDLLSQGVMSLLGQHLADIHQSFSICQRHTEQGGDSEPRDKTSNMGKCCKNHNEADRQMSFAGRSVFAKLSYGCVITSPKGYAAGVSETLRASTRPIALTHPDYRVITEVMLASIGFSEATSLSRRLVYLFSLAKDSLCMPEFINDGQTGWLVMLQKVISATCMHLQQSACLQVVSDEKKVVAGEPDGQKPSHGTQEKSQIVGEAKGPRHQFAFISQGVNEEKSLVKALLSVVLASIQEHKNVVQFHTLLKEIFPISCYFPAFQHQAEEEEQRLIKRDITEELQRTGFLSDTQVVCNALSLYQAMKFSQAVLLVGPSGSGKTTCHHALAGALRRLAAPRTEPQIPTSTWCSVDTVVLFPNAMSHEEMFGGCCEEEQGWWDGAFTKGLRHSEGHGHSATDLSSSDNSKKDQMQKVKWLVMDGEPLGQPGWLDYFALCNPEDPSLCLSSNTGIKLLAEITDLGGAAPSAVTSCSLVYFTGTDLWKAVWKAEVDALSRKHSVDLGTLKMWKCLAEDLFHSTLNCLRDRALTPAMHNERGGTSTYGLQEVMSFSRILHAFLEQIGKGPGLKDEPKHKNQDTRDMPLGGIQTSGTDAWVTSIQRELQARNLFLVAYVWGFGGHLHPRHWPQFDVFTRELLFNSRYRVEVPDEETVFDHFLNQSEIVIGDTINTINCLRTKSRCLVYPTIPQYDKYFYLLDMMLEANQPALLVGEASSGKTMLCETLLSQGRPHMCLPVSPCLTAGVLRKVLNDIRCQRTCLSTSGTRTKLSALHLFVDDLHEAPCDAFGKTSKALETLRQCISKGGFLTSDGYHFKLFSSQAISYMATCRASGSGHSSNSVISSRLFRLFSILVLPSLSINVLFSIYSPLLKPWLKDLPCMPSYADMASCIITATHNLYDAVCKHFQHTALRPHFIFSHHDLRKVFQGMCLWQPHNPNTHPLETEASHVVGQSSSTLGPCAPALEGPAACVLSIARLWMHECLRTFGDRLCSEEETTTLVSLIAEVSETYYGCKLFDKPHSVSAEGTSPPVIHTPFAPSPEGDGHMESPSRCPNTTNELDNNGVPPSRQVAEPIVVLTAQREETDLRPSDRSRSRDENTSIMAVETNKGRMKDNEMQAAGSCEVFTPTPPEGPKPAHQSDRRSWHKSAEQSPQNNGKDSQEPSPANPLLLLQLLEKTMDTVVYSPDLTEAVGQQHNDKCNSYQERDSDLLVQQLAAIVKRREEGLVDNYSITSNCMVHKQMVQQVVHIIRALLMPGGHGILFGGVKGTGRKTVVRLAAYLMGYQLMEVHPGNEKQLHEILMEASNQTRMCGGNVVILAHEEISHAVRDELMAMMANGTFQGFYSDEGLRNSIPRTSVVKSSLESYMTDPSFERYFKQLQRKVHVFLLLPCSSDSIETPENKASMTQALLAKALGLCCCVEVYQAWSNQSLVEAASHLKANLQTSDLDVERANFETRIFRAMAGIHQSTLRYTSVYLDAQSFSPQTYVEFIAHFIYLCNHLSKQRLGQANRFATVLAHVEVMMNTAVQYKQDLIALKDNITGTEQCEKQLLRAMSTERAAWEHAQQTCAEEKDKLYQLEQQIDQITLPFDEASPLFQSVLKALKCLNQSDLDEVRHYTSPPEGVVKVMDAICLLFNRPCNWESAKQLLWQPKCFQEFEFFDRGGLSDDQLQKLCRIVHSPQFQPESVREVSRACEPLCHWARAVYQCTREERHVSPQEEHRRRLKVLAVEAQGRLRTARLQEDKVSQRLQDMERQVQFVQQDLEELLIKQHRAESLEGEAAAVISQLESKIVNWKDAAQGEELNNKTIHGDALISAAIITYLGPFGSDIRAELVSKWRELCLTGEMNINPEDHRTYLFTDIIPAPPNPPLDVPIPVAEKPLLALARAVGVDQRQVHGLPARLMVRLLQWGYRGPCAQHWPLLADAQQHEEITGDDSKPQMDNDYGMVICADDPELLGKLGQAAEKGLKVLVTHVERAVPSPKLLAILAHPAGSAFPRFRPPFRSSTHPEFCLALSTRLPIRLLRSEINPSILSAVRVIDLSLSTVEIQELMLTELVQSERMGVLMQHSLFRMQNVRKALQEKLAEEEVSLTEYIMQSLTPLLQDPDFIPRVVACQAESEKLQTEIQHLNTELERQEPLLTGLQRVARMAAALYQALQDVARLSPVYLFPLGSFLTAMRRVPCPVGRTHVTLVGGEVTEDMLAEFTHRMVTHLLAQYRPCLFQSHGTVLRLLVAVALFQDNEPSSETERVAFLRGFSDVDFPACVKPRCPPSTASPPATSRHALPGWIPPHVHPELLLLQRIPSFTGLVASLASSPRQWQEYLGVSSSTVVGAVPCRSHAHLNCLQRALLWKTLRPHCLAIVAEGMAACHLALSRCTAVDEDPHTGNPEALSRFLAKHEGPVILTLPSPGGEGLASIHPLHLLKQLSRYHPYAEGVQVNVISLGAKCEREVILSALNKAAIDGHWVVFNNCHLLERWDEKVMSRLHQLISSPKGVSEGEGPCAHGQGHPHFRLWFLTRGCPPCAIPAAVRTCALNLVCDSPWGLKEELSCSLRHVVGLARSGLESDVKAASVEPLLRCSLLHSVLLQRQAHRNRDQRTLYCWSQEDLQALVDAHVRLAHLCDNKNEALEYIAVNVVYGGHVSDSADLEVVESVAKACLGTTSALRGGGPHVLSDIIQIPGHFDTSGLLQCVEQRIQDVANISDPLLLGFSAHLAGEMVKVDSQTLNMLLRDSQTPVGKIRSAGNELSRCAMLADFTQTRDRLQALKSGLALKDTSVGTVSQGPLRSFLQTEWDALIDLVSSLLSELNQPIQQNQMTVASFTLASLSHLERRADLLSAYHGDAAGVTPPAAYRLSAFRNARGFLVSVMREACRAERRDVSNVALCFEVLSAFPPGASLPQGDVYLCGLELRGALWDSRLEALQDTLSPKPCVFPLLRVRAAVRNTETVCASDAPRLNYSHLTNANTVHVSDTPPCRVSQLPLYHCPLYLDRENGDRGLADANLITHVPLAARLDPVLCSLRRVRLVSTL